MDGAYTPWAERVNALAYDWEYQNMISLLAAKYAAIGHKVLVVSDRVDFLKRCAKLVGDNAICVTGDIPHEKRPELIKDIFTDKKDVLFGTQSIFSEGIELYSSGRARAHGNTEEEPPSPAIHREPLAPRHQHDSQH